MIKFMKNVNTFQIAEVKPQKVLLDMCLIFFQSGVAYESVAYQKWVYLFTNLLSLQMLFISR